VIYGFSDLVLKKFCGFFCGDLEFVLVNKDISSSCIVGSGV